MVSMSKIILKGDPLISEEYACSGTITPGQLMDLNSSSQWVPAAAGSASRTVAVERSEFGVDYNHAYDSGEVIKAAAMYPGCRFHARLYTASGAQAAVAIGDILTSVASGYVAEREAFDAATDGSPTDAEINSALNATSRFRAHQRITDSSNVSSNTNRLIDVEVL